jgi:alkanesulfonate monooxygenase SsuD/methylene tetrahydromethanopterin reductase-like flavin-dependent oxidoreductase (luciferase family)
VQPSVDSVTPRGCSPYKNRLALAELYDRLGFHCFHMSEHHGATLSMTPSPSVWMAALSQRTKRLRLCPLVYLLPIYHPARSYEEICILDHLSGGRFEFGIGRGASPHELDALGIDPAKAAQMYAQAFDTIQRCFAQTSITTTGEFWRLNDYAVEMKPQQRPHPPLWYAVGSPDSVVWPARNGVNVVCGGQVSRVRAISDRYREERAAAGLHRESSPLIGVLSGRPTAKLTTWVARPGQHSTRISSSSGGSMERSPSTRSCRPRSIRSPSPDMQLPARLEQSRKSCPTRSRSGG